MTMAYQDYQQVDTPWFAQVPSHWNMTRVGLAYQVSLGKMLQSSPKSESDQELPYLRSANVQAGVIKTDDLNTMWFSQAEISELTLRDGDLMITEGGDIGRCAMWTGAVEDCLYQNSVHRVRSSGPSTERFLFYWMNLVKSSGYLDVTSNKATIAHLTADKLNTLPLLVPPRDEQIAIAAFLDHETGKIDDLVAQQEQLITLLNEKRQAVISHAVTKGLNPDVEMKDSGIKWLGEVPAHWRVGRLSSCSKIIAGFPFSSDLFGTEGIPIIRMSDFSDGKIRPETAAKVAVDNVPESSLAEAGDILLGLSGSISNYAEIFEHQTPVAINQRVAMVRSSKSCGILLKWFLQSPLFIKQIESILPSTTIQNISMSQLAAVRLAIPPLEEANRITEYLADFIGRLDTLKQDAISGIHLLKERRSALISAAVTGNIDVRNHPAAVAALNKNKDN